MGALSLGPLKPAAPRFSAPHAPLAPAPCATLSASARQDPSAPPPPPPPPPPANLPPNLILDDVNVLEAFKPKPAPVLPKAPPSYELKVLNLLDGKETGELVKLDKSVFGAPIRTDIVHKVVTWQRAKRRSGTAATKRPGELRGSTKKLRPQKGAGKARVGKRRAPQMRGGYKAHGPRQRDFSFKLNKKVRAMGLRAVLSAKAFEGNLVIVEHFKLPEAKTRLVAGVLDRENWGMTLFVDGHEADPGFVRASRNLQKAKALPQLGANVLDIVKAQTLVLSREAVDLLTKRLRPEQ